MSHKIFVLLLPYPVSLNAMFANGGRSRIKSKRYKAWIVEADLMIMKQKPLKRFEGMVDIEIKCGFGRKDADISNLVKGPEDLLVRYGIIKDDSRKIVRSIKAAWDETITGCQITVIEI